MSGRPPLDPAVGPGPVAVFALVAVALLATGVGGASAQENECGDRAALRVAVTDESGTVALPGATVVLRWTDAERRPVRTPADSDGRWSVCAPRDAGAAVLWAEYGDGSSEQAAVSLARGETREVALRVLLGAVPTGRLVGRVYDVETGDPVVTAAVSLVGRAAEADSDRQGRFRLSGIPVGAHELEVRRIGYAPLQHAVGVGRGLTTEVEVGLTRDPVELEPLVATATRVRRLEIKGFYERKQWGELLGLGTFFTEADIERRRPQEIAFMIAEESGVRLSGGRFYSTRMSAGLSNPRAGCWIDTYLDGINIGNTPLHTLVKPVEVGGVEVYKGAASLPAEFGGSGGQCGAIVVWTK